MLPDEANLIKQKKRQEQVKRYIEQIESDYNMSNKKKNITKVKFPQGCVFLAACTANDFDEVQYYLKNGVNINTTNVDGLTALHQVSDYLMIKFISHIDNFIILN
jgi:protein phosphatase 1 regulatory subunit 12A